MGTTSLSASLIAILGYAAWTLTLLITIASQPASESGAQWSASRKLLHSLG